MKNIQNEYQSMKRRIPSMLEVPEQIVSNLPFITVLGNQRLKIENYHAICAFSDSELVFFTKIGKIRIGGKNLCILCYTRSELVLEGVLQEISFKNKG